VPTFAKFSPKCGEFERVAEFVESTILKPN
jgi:hypothetical protein